MKIHLLILTFLTIFIYSNSSAQNDNDNCPTLFTHERTINPKINIVNIEVIDSNKFDSFPRFKGKIETISKKIVYPEIAKRAGVEGIVKLLMTLDSTGNVIKTIIMNTPGAGTDYFALDIIQKEKFYPAVLNHKNVPSPVVVDINFDLNLYVDKPSMEIDEIKYELFGGMIFLHITIIIKKDGSAFFSEDRGYEPPKIYHGKINSYEYTKLNDFIVAQCFFEYDNEYVLKAINDTGKTIITVKSGNIIKSVLSKGQLEPVGLWAIRTVILQEKDKIQWEEIKE